MKNSGLNVATSSEHQIDRGGQCHDIAPTSDRQYFVEIWEGLWLLLSRSREIALDVTPLDSGTLSEWDDVTIICDVAPKPKALWSGIAT